MLDNKITTKTFITTSLILIILLTGGFSWWRMTSTNTWLEELKKYITHSINELKIDQEKNISMLKENENLIFENMKKNDIIYNKILSNQQFVLKIKEQTEKEANIQIKKILDNHDKMLEILNKLEAK